jgi:hypothetical protein
VRGTPSMALQMLKQRVSRRMRKWEAESELRQFWQARFYDFNVFTERKTEKWEYMHGNP